MKDLIIWAIPVFTGAFTVLFDIGDRKLNTLIVCAVSFLAYTLFRVLIKRWYK